MSSERTATALDVDGALADIARGVTSRHLVDACEPRLVLAPRSVDEVARCLVAANDAGLVVVPWGGGTQMGLGNLPESVDVGLDLRGLNAIVEYEPDDMTIAVQAGHPLGELNRLLATHGQMLPVDAADPERATLGGLVAAGMSGPRRFGYAPLRDLIIGISAVLPDGRVAKAGGMVVKNVSGFDLMRLYHGSLGSLAVIVQVNLKVLPRSQSERTVLVRYDNLSAASTAAEAVRVSQLGATAIVLLDRGAAIRSGIEPAPWTLAVRCEAPPVAVVRQAERVVEVAGAAPRDADVAPADETGSLWARIAGLTSAAQDDAEIGVRLGVPPSRLAAAGAVAAGLAASVGENGALLLDAGSGLLYARIAGAHEALSTAWQQLSAHGAHATLIAAPPAVKQATDVFGPQPPGFEVMRALKEQFDSHRTLNRGRFAGHL